MQDDVDVLQIKIEKAKSQLPEATLDAISAVPWQAAILKMRETKGFSFEQLGNLEIETELLLCGLITADNYPKELEARMKISSAQANELVNEMNLEVFSKIREEMIKNAERKKIFVKKEPTPIKVNIVKPIVRETETEKKASTEAFASHGVEIIPEKLEIKGNVPPIFSQKLTSSFQTPTVKTEHSLDNLTKVSSTPTPAVTYPKNSDPYRIEPE